MLQLEHMTTDQTISELMQRVSRLEDALINSNKRIRTLERRNATCCPNCKRDNWDFRAALCQCCEAKIDHILEAS